MKTKPERQYDIFLVMGEDPIPPQGAQLLTTYDAKAGGHWAIQYGSTMPQFEGISSQMGSMTNPTWGNSGL